MLIRHCGVCGREIEVSLPYSKQYVYHKPRRRWCHIDCFKDITARSSTVDKWIEETSKFVLTEVSKDNVCQLFFNHYEISCISQRMFIKLDQIYKGTYKGLAQPIPPHELYDMLIRKMDYLDALARKKGLSGEQRANYDLQVVVGSYKDYKAWLTRIKAEEDLKKEKAKQLSSDPSQNKLQGYVPPDPFKSKENEVNIEDFLE